MTQLKPCKKCGSQPTLHRPSKYDPEYRHQHGLMSNFEPEPYYRCENCRMIKELEKNNRIAANWNEANK
mgnify:CR=1 FL=1